MDDFPKLGYVRSARTAAHKRYVDEVNSEASIVANPMLAEGLI